MRCQRLYVRFETEQAYKDYALQLLIGEKTNVKDGISNSWLYF